MSQRVCHLWFLAALVSACLVSACADPAVGGLDASQLGAVTGDAAAADALVLDAAAADAPTDGEPAHEVEDTGDGALADAVPPVDVLAPAQCATTTDCPAAPPCHAVACSDAGKCTYSGLADGQSCDDGNACTLGDVCAASACAGTELAPCDDENPCTADKCNPLAGCVNLAVTVTTACDDGDACTQQDACANGKCASGLNICQCQVTADCGKYEDGDVCNGTLYCDAAGGPPYTCKLNPASVIVCPATADTACQKNTCFPASGACQLVVAPENTPCSDGDACTTGDVCDKGLCAAGTNTCFCKQDADCKGMEDGNACNGTLYCNKATAQCQLNPVTVVNCFTVDDTACSKNTCNPKDGNCYVIPVNEAKACDDGNPCTPNEACAQGQCTTATNTCECQKDADCAAKDDGNPCNGISYCDIKAARCVVNPATVVHCNNDDDPACLHDECNPKTGKCEANSVVMNGAGCDDGNPCTPVDVCAAGVCAATSNVCECQLDSDCQAKEDGSLCNGTLFCDKKSSKCVVNPASVVVCAGAFDEPCLTNQCDPKTGGCGMKPAYQGNQCPGENACSAGGWCALGTCAVTTQSKCTCQNDADCGKFEDGDLCNGSLYCDSTGTAPVCKLNPKTVVVCPVGQDGACTKNTCQPDNGVCAMKASAGLCSDGEPCTLGDACQQGACAPGVPTFCEDGNACTSDKCLNGFGCVHQPKDASACDDANPCTSDLCQPAAGCVHGYLTGACNDQSPCTTGDACKDGTCGGNTVACDDKNHCTDDACKPNAGGCVYLPNAATCSDGNACTQADVCSLGQCSAGGALACGSGNSPCIKSSCDPKAGCVALTVTGPCEDGDACTAGDACKDGGCAGALKTCDDGNPCTDDSCDIKLGCTHGSNVAPCSDGNACTSGDACKDGKCQYVKGISCDDANPCTDDGCDPKIGCSSAANSVPCDDGNACTSKDGCKLGQCVGLVGACDDGNACTNDGCSAGKCAYVNNIAECNDGNACTTGDQCALGKCAGAGKLDCDDKNVCTSDACDAGAGCSHVGNAALCNDDNACTQADACNAGQCAGAKKVCDDGNPCTDDACDAKTGCVAVPNTAPCSDQSACTAGDACLAGKCAPGKAKDCGDDNLCTADSCLAATGQCANLDTGAKDCDDKNACTDDPCHPKLGCGHNNNAIACSDGNPCTTGDGCKGGLCATTGALGCDDSKPCTTDSCDPKQGCVYAFNTAPCDDGVACTKSDACAGGSCKGTINCDDGNACTDDSCDYGTGKCASLANAATCSDGNACTESEACKTGSCVLGKIVVCDDANPCTADYCDNASGCAAPNDDKLTCKLAATCTNMDACSAGKCVLGSKPRFYDNHLGLGTMQERAVALVALPDGGAILGGINTAAYSNGGGEGNSGLWRVNAAGDQVWEKTVSYSNEDQVQDVALAPDGKLLVSGFGYNNFGLYLAKYDLTGKQEWLAQTTDGYYQTGYAIATRKIGTDYQHVVCGNISAGEPPFARLAYFGDKGNAILATKWKGPNSGGHGMECRDIVANPDNTLLWAGWTNDTTDANGFLVGAKAAILQTVDLGWGAYDRMTVKRYGGAGDDVFESLAAALGPQPGWFAAGSTTSKGAGKHDAWLVRLDGNYNVMWDATYGEANDDYYHAVVPMADGGAVAAGSFRTGSQPNSFFQVARYDASGKKVWQMGGGNGGDYHEIFDLALAPGADILLGGVFASSSKDQFVIKRISPWANENCGSPCGKVTYAGCDDAEFCTYDDCNSTNAACLHKALTTPMACDGNACTVGDSCASGACAPGEATVCDDGNPCTLETCDKAKGCVKANATSGVACGAGKTCQAVAGSDSVCK